jgi:hypothetical protein
MCFLFGKFYWTLTFRDLLRMSLNMNEPTEITHPNLQEGPVRERREKVRLLADEMNQENCRIKFRKTIPKGPF